MKIRRLILWFLALLPALLPSPSPGAGVTLITHGLNGNVDDWIIHMAGQIPLYPGFPGTNYSCLEIYFMESGGSFVLTNRLLAGRPPAETDSGEILVKLDWSQLANNSYSTYEVADRIVPRLFDPLFIPELNGHALVEMPLHLIGHSRGGSLVCEMSKDLGAQGLWVDHVTTLDPHPLNNDGFFDFPYSVVDATAVTYENVLFADNYFQEINLLFYGERVPGAYFRELTNLDGGYDSLAGSHSDVHLWYYGTIDLRTPTFNNEATFGNAMRNEWFTAFESRGTNAGFIYSLLGGGNRQSDALPAGPGQGRVSAGLNQWWDFGAGLSNNRTPLPVNAGIWPNLLQLHHSATNPVTPGQMVPLSFGYQFGQPATSPALIAFFLDPDTNPYNGNQILLGTNLLAGTGSEAATRLPAAHPVNPDLTPPGRYQVGGLIHDGIHTRILYANGPLEVEADLTPPILAVSGWMDSLFQVTVQGVPGQILVLDASSDFAVWQPVATNTLAADQFAWTYTDSSSSAESRRFYRARLHPQ